MSNGAFDCQKKSVSRTPLMNERTLLAELELLEPWCKKVPLNAVAHSTSASPAVAGSVPRRQAPILDGFPVGVVRTFRPQPCFSKAKSSGSFDTTSCTGSMDGENLASVVSPSKADPLIESAKANHQPTSLDTHGPTQKHPSEADQR